MISNIIIATLLVFLAAAELSGATDNWSARRLASFLIVPIIPLLILFLIMIALDVIKISA